jgi:hypothetical protein
MGASTSRTAGAAGTGAVWQVEMGPNGGDEVNILQAGANYGWPLVSLGRNYASPWHSEKFQGDGFHDPVIFWMPSISTSSLAFYTGDRLPKWKGEVFVGGMRYGRSRERGSSTGSCSIPISTSTEATLAARRCPAAAWTTAWPTGRMPQPRCRVECAPWRSRLVRAWVRTRSSPPSAPAAWARCIPPSTPG